MAIQTHRPLPTSTSGRGVFASTRNYRIVRDLLVGVERLSIREVYYDDGQPWAMTEPLDVTDASADDGRKPLHQMLDDATRLPVIDAGEIPAPEIAGSMEKPRL